MRRGVWAVVEAAGRALNFVPLYYLAILRTQILSLSVLRSQLFDNIIVKMYTIIAPPNTTFCRKNTTNKL